MSKFVLILGAAAAVLRVLYPPMAAFHTTSGTRLPCKNFELFCVTDTETLALHLGVIVFVTVVAHQVASRRSRSDEGRNTA